VPAVRPFAGIIVCLVLACNDNEVVTAAATPGRQFVFEGLTIQERRDGKVVWLGTARRADGDLTDADVQEVKLRCISNAGNGKPYDVSAPRAHLELDLGKARFEAVHIVDEQGVTLDAGAADYDEAAGRIVASGPLTFTAHGLDAHATSATVMLETGQVDITGPVEGRYQKPKPKP
jgi:hypothetical protein